MRIEIRKRIGKKEITAIHYLERTLASEISFYIYNDRIATMLFADAPLWARNVVNLNKHNLSKVGAK